MIDSPARFVVAMMFCFLLTVSALYRLWKIVIIGHISDMGKATPLFLTIMLAGAVLSFLPIPLYTEDVPGTTRIVTAHVIDKDLDPSHEEMRSDVDLMPTFMPMGDSMTIGLTPEPSEMQVHVPSRYSVLLGWENQKAWLSVDARLYRKLQPDSVVSVQLKEQREVSLLMKYKSTRLVVGPILTAEAAPPRP